MSELLSLESKVVEVRLYRAGAVVRRQAVLETKALEAAAASSREACVTGLPLTIQEESVRVWLEANDPAALPSPADVRVELVLPPPGASLVTPTEAEIAASEFAIERLDEKLARIDFEMRQLGSTTLALPAPFKNHPPQPAPVDAWLGLVAFTDEQKKRLVVERAALAQERELAEEQRLRLQRQAASARAAQDAVGDAVSKRVVFALRGGASQSVDPRPVTVVIEYCVAGARWAPAYVFRMHHDGSKAELSQRALVVQQSGEAWTHVRLSLSTADLAQEMHLPELASLRLGRRQAAPIAPAWREPPAGAEALFEGLDVFFASAVRPVGARIAPLQAPPLLAKNDASLSPEMRFGGVAAAAETGAMPAALLEPEPPYPEEEAMADFAASAVTEGLTQVPSRRGGVAKSKRVATRPLPPQPAPVATACAPMMPPAAAPMSARRDVNLAARSRASRRSSEDAVAKETASSAFMDMEVMAITETTSRDGDQTRELRYGRLVMVDWQDPVHRGKLRPATLVDELPSASSLKLETLSSRLLAAEADSRRVEQITFPPGSEPLESSCGSYDYRYDADGFVDVPSDGMVHNLPVASHEARAESTLVVVPRVSLQAVRTVRIKNPLRGPLLAGAADVYLGDEFLVTAPIRSVPVGGELIIGLGVEEALKVARNSSFEEDKGGLLRGGSLLKHSVDIEIASRLAYLTRVEVRERIPIKEDGDDEVVIEVTHVNPSWEPFEQLESEPIKGGKRWCFELGPGEAKKLTFAYSIKINAKNEIVGGNRRET